MATNDFFRTFLNAMMDHGTSKRFGLKFAGVR